MRDFFSSSCEHILAGPHEFYGCIESFRGKIKGKLNTGIAVLGFGCLKEWKRNRNQCKVLSWTTVSVCVWWLQLSDWKPDETTCCCLSHEESDCPPVHLSAGINGPVSTGTFSLTIKYVPLYIERDELFQKSCGGDSVTGALMRSGTGGGRLSRAHVVIPLRSQRF